jgi:hypothetical protein
MKTLILLETLRNGQVVKYPLSEVQALIVSPAPSIR